LVASTVVGPLSSFWWSVIWLTLYGLVMAFLYLATSIRIINRGLHFSPVSEKRDNVTKTLPNVPIQLFEVSVAKKALLSPIFLIPFDYWLESSRLQSFKTIQFSTPGN
jgi:hypothetical protein